MGEYVERLLSDYDYFGTRLPRIPTMIERELKGKMEQFQEKKARKAHNLETMERFTEGSILSVYSNQVGNA
jgi:hypothetical protein